MKTLRAHDGTEFPAIGLGTGSPAGAAAAQAVQQALEAGYRLIDSAYNYENEGAVGRGVRASSVPRSSIMVQSKLPGRYHEYEIARQTIEESVYRTGLEHIDVYLIHWPNPRVDKYVEAWQALIDARERGLVTHIGVSNFLPEHLERLENETGVRPVVNQLEVHPAFSQEEAIAYHRERGIIVQAWSPLDRVGSLMESQEILDVATAHGVSPVEAVLAWHVARGVVPLPRSAHPERQAVNLAAANLELTQDEREAITSLDRLDGGRKDRNPAEYEEF